MIPFFFSASMKMQVDGATLVLESDGTLMDDDNTLKIMYKDTFILLTKDEVWQSSTDEKLTPSYTSTVTYKSDTSFGDNASSSVLINDPASEDREEYSSGPVTDITWKNFKIPWNEMRPTILKDCESDTKNSTTINEVVRIVADSLIEIKENVPSKALKYVAAKIIARYPKKFQDIDDAGNIWGDGTHTLFSKLRERIKYCNRSKHKHEKRKGDMIPIENRKKMLVAKAGCSNWHPDMNKSTTDVNKIKEDLKHVNFEELNSDTIDMLEESYALQRTFINGTPPPTAEDILQNWPILFTKEGVKWHYKKLMNQDISKLTENLLIKSEKILNFGINKKYIDIRPTVEDDIILAVLKILTTYFKEDLSLLYLVVHVKPINYRSELYLTNKVFLG